MTSDLKAFYKAYAAWLDVGAPEGEPFTRAKGLCWTVSVYVQDTFGGGRGEPAVQDMMQALIAADLDGTLPFNNSDGYIKGYGYGSECYLGTCHLNPKRAEWVRKHAAE